MEKNFKLFCFGFGQVAKYFVKNLIKNNFDIELITTNTAKTQSNKFGNLKYKSYYFNDEKFDGDLLNDLNASNKVLVSIPPINKGDIVLKKFGNNFIKGKFDWITYLSATSVYGDKKGQWVDENTNPKPSLERGIARLKAENEWLNYYQDYNLPLQIFRLTGIYSLESNVIKRLKMGKIKIVEKRNHFFSRIHVEDIAEVLALSLKKFDSGQIYNISDDYPCSYGEIIKYAANLMNMNVPEKINLSDIENEALKDFYIESKRVNNRKMKFFFNYRLKYPTFKEGLDMIKNNIV